MVGIGIGKVTLLLLSLYRLSYGEDSVITVDNLQGIMKEMLRRFNQPELKRLITNQNNQRTDKMATGKQYSIALQLSKEDCRKGQLGSNIPADFKTVRDTLADEEVYHTDNVVAAIPKHIYKLNTKKGTDHSEYRVLMKLREQQIKPGCLIVYTHVTPCLSMCLNESRVDVNIIDLLSNLKNQNQNTDIALVFGSLFHYDKTHNTKKQIYDNLKKILVSVHCCYEGRNRVTCAMFDKNKDKDQHCLSEMV